MTIFLRFDMKMERQGGDWKIGGIRSWPVWSKAVHFLNEPGSPSMLAAALSGFSPVIRSKA
ncbi:hypothetical protein [Caldibacillus debilis]|uniref:hypothetical protein n=1 Tax=Caldibacillus debilis TaxID=301148 RepID=UPI0023F348E4|nr:hypothetical protein [Caldibacillus debilis]